MPKKPTNPVTGKGTKQTNLKDYSKREQKQIMDMTSKMTKIALQNKKIISIMIMMDINGNVQVIQFGATNEIEKRSKFMANKIADMIPAIITAYDIPQPEVPGEEKAKA